MTFKLLITSRSFGTVESESKALLESENIQVDHATASEFDSLIENYDALIIGAHPFPSELMEKCRKLKIICKHGAEIDNIPGKSKRARNYSNKCSGCEFAACCRLVIWLITDYSTANCIYQYAGS